MHIHAPSGILCSPPAGACAARLARPPGPGPDDGEHPGPQIDIWPAQAGCFTAAQTMKRQAPHDAQPVRGRYGQERDSNLRPAPGLTDLQLISTPSAIALHIRLARCDHGRSSSGGGEGDDRGGTSQRSVNAERSTNCSVLVTLPSLPALAAPALPFPDMRWAYRARPCARRPAGPGGDVRGSAPWRADRGSDSDYNILTMAISSADPV